MEYSTRRRLAIMDAVAWPSATAWLLFHDAKQMGGLEMAILLLILCWAARKLGHAREGYRAPSGGWIAFNPFNPLGWILLGFMKLLRRREGDYEFMTLKAIKLGLGVGVVALLYWANAQGWL